MCPEVERDLDERYLAPALRRFRESLARFRNRDIDRVGVFDAMAALLDAGAVLLSESPTGGAGGTSS